LCPFYPKFDSFEAACLKVWQLAVTLVFVTSSTLPPVSLLELHS
jgi:hypothetical protein